MFNFLKKRVSSVRRTYLGVEHWTDWQHLLGRSKYMWGLFSVSRLLDEARSRVQKRRMGESMKTFEEAATLYQVDSIAQHKMMKRFLIYACFLWLIMIIGIVYAVTVLWHSGLLTFINAMLLNGALFFLAIRYFDWYRQIKHRDLSISSFSKIEKNLRFLIKKR